nr:helix-turn-helix domain-containing protein [Spirulina subsalsa]
MKARYQYKIYPTTQQQQGLAQLFGCVRVAFKEDEPKICSFY